MERKVFFNSLLFLIIISNIWFGYSEYFTKIDALEVTPDTIVESGDVVILNYTLWVDNQVDDIQNGTVYVKDPIDSSVPGKIYNTYPDVHTPPNTGFYESVLGMRAGNRKTVNIPFSSGKAFNNVSDRLYGEDLFYEIFLLEILLDGSQPGLTLFDLPFFLPIVLLVSIVLIIVLIFRVRHYMRTQDLLRLRTRCSLCGGFAEVTCNNPGCKTPYCKKCFVQNSGCPICHTNAMVQLK